MDNYGEFPWDLGLFSPIYNLGDLDIGFVGENDEIITNEDGNNLETFGEYYTGSMYEHETILWDYYNVKDKCVDKQVLKDLFNMLYSSDTKISINRFENYEHSNVIDTENMKCFFDPAWGGVMQSQLESETKNGNQRTLKYNILYPSDDLAGTYTLDFRLENGYWKIISEKQEQFN